MKKFFVSFFFISLFLVFSILIILSTKGVETNKFNNILLKKIKENNRYLNVKLLTIKFKIDIKELSLFLETNNPIIVYRDTNIPTKNIKIYINVVSLIKSETQLEKINLVFDQLDIQELKRISSILKPSNLNSFINNRVHKGKLDLEMELYLDKKNSFNDFIAKGSVSHLKTQLKKDIFLENISFKFFADKSDILLQNIKGNNGGFNFEEGDLKINFSSEISLEANFLSNIQYNENSKKILKFFNDTEYFKNINSLKGRLNNNIKLTFDKTYKVKKYQIKSDGNLFSLNLKYKKPIYNFLSNDKIKEISLKDTKIEINISQKIKNIDLIGDYRINKNTYEKFNIISKNKKDSFIADIVFDYNDPIILKQINYEKSSNEVANFSIKIEKNKDFILFKKINFLIGKNIINIKNIKFEKKKFKSFDIISIKTYKNGKINNEFNVKYGKKILINGNNFDAVNLITSLNKEVSNDEKFLSELSKEIEIDLKSISIPLSKKLEDFKLIGKIEKGKFIKIISKGDYGNKKFLDISLKYNKKNNKKFLEIYSDVTQPLLSDLSFFKGLKGGNLHFVSTFEEDKSLSKLKIENFKVINAPGMVKLLSLADLGGLADLAEGEGISFDILEIDMEKNKDYLQLKEILAHGPSISVLMEGYQSNEITSLRGTLVPAKTLNKMISKIPVIGNIVIPKEVGEGLFGISFKIKGPPGEIKTTINPIRTITPRFIQKIIDKNKKTK